MTTDITRIEQRIKIEARPETVFSFLTDPAKPALWQVQHVAGALTRGGHASHARSSRAGHARLVPLGCAAGRARVAAGPRARPVRRGGGMGGYSPLGILDEARVVAVVRSHRATHRQARCDRRSREGTCLKLNLPKRGVELKLDSASQGNEACS